MLRDEYDIHEYPYKDNDGDFSSVIHRICIPSDMSEDAARELIRNDPEFGRTYDGCGHEYDCCGCWFLSGYQLHLLDEWGGAYHFMLERSYSRNY